MDFQYKKLKSISIRIRIALTLFFLAPVSSFRYLCAMTSRELLERFRKHPAIKFLENEIEKGHRKFRLAIPQTSAVSLLWSGFFLENSRNMLWIAPSKEDAHIIYSDLVNFVPEDKLRYLPASFREIRTPAKTDAYEQMLRLLRFEELTAGQTPFFIVTYPEAVLENWPDPETWKNMRFQISVNDKLDPDFLNEMLFEYDFERTDIVTEPGEFALRGGIVDVFPRESAVPYRIEFRDDKIFRIRSFDVESQLTEKEVKQLQISASSEEIRERMPFHKLIPANTLVYWHNPGMIKELAESLPREEPYKSLLNLSFDPRRWEDKFICVSPQYRDAPAIPLHTEVLPPFRKNFQLFLRELSENTRNGITNVITAPHHMQEKRLDQILREYPGINYQILRLNLYEGFKDRDLNLAVYPERQIFDKPPKKIALTSKKKKEKHILREFNDWQKGDYIVHQDYGIGIYEGLVKIQRAGKTEETVKLRYKNDDILYVSVHALYKLSKYRNKDGKPPKIYRLGSPAWNTLKQKTKKRIKKLAFDLLKLYAERKQQKGFAFGPDSRMQWELESSFIYEDTPDQKKATEEVKKDMESERPMDRIVCGDVGFGKTEIAVRAAFKAVDNGKQVAVLVPTTILAFQHYRTFSERLKNFPVTVDYLNRFRTTKEKNRIISELKEGKIDIIIGTHQLVNDKIKFKDLGLLIIDEEHKFGVNIKEKLKNLKKNIDVLTLTATPIPRTLQFSLMGERDLSLINTPPPNRYPIHTLVTHFDPRSIEEGIRRELERGGQVFFIHNRINNLEEVASFIQRLVPEAKIAVAHGKTPGKELEKIMLDFSMGKYDILVSTAIVESGLDVPNANTIFINDAHQFGLADLHQLRGRVGRSNRQAYCYFIIPSYESLTREARKRMHVLETYTALGSGFEIAMKDLEIRGAGDLLGAEQSGFINELGFDLYQKILQEAVEEVKQEEFSHLENANIPQPADVQIQSDLEWSIPTAYIPASKERMYFYRKLSEVKSPEELEKVVFELEDRFGPLPPQAEELIKAVEIKYMLAAMGFEKMVIKQGKMLLYFPSDEAFFHSGKWQKILSYIQNLDENIRLKKKNDDRLYLIFSPVDSTARAYAFIQKMYSHVMA